MNPSGNPYTAFGPGPVLELAMSQEQPGTIRITRVTARERHVVGSLQPEEPAPGFDTHATGTRTIVALDVLEYVIDEEAWIQSLAEALAPGSDLVLRVPVEGPVAWLDARNLYRYLQDVSGWGKELKETRMKGWRRHYRPDELVAMVVQAGLTVVDLRVSGSPHLEAAQFGALVWGKLIRRNPDAEQRANAWRDQRERALDLPRMGALSTKVTIRARRPAATR